MFRKLYKEANDNIKVDEALLEKTLAAAFSDKPKKKTYYYRPVTSIAAAVVLVIGVSVAYPELTKEPVTETTTIETEQSTDTQWQNMSLTPVSTPESTPEEAPAALKQQKQSVSKPPKPVATPSPVITAAPVSVEQEQVADTETMVAADTEAVPAIARAGGVSEFNAYNDAASMPEDFVQISAEILSDGTEVYKYENSESKSFTVSISESDIEAATGIQFLKDGKTYTLQSDNMTDEELTAAYEKLEF